MKPAGENQRDTRSKERKRSGNIIAIASLHKSNSLDFENNRYRENLEHPLHGLFRRRLVE